MILSIIIPFYKVEDYLDECLSSIFRIATHDDFEVILVNDGTPDNSMAIAERYAASYENVHILDQENQGLSAARMNGLALASGDYVWFIDSDDWVLQEGFREVIELVKNKVADLIVTPLLTIYPDNGKKQKDFDTVVPRIGTGKEYLRNHAFPIWAAPRYIIHRRLFHSTSLFFPLGLLHEDEYFGRVLLYLAQSVFILEEPAYAYRIREGSITTVPKIKSSEDILKVHELLMSFSESCVQPDDRKWFQYDTLRMIRKSFTRNERLLSTKAFKSFRRKNLHYILKEYKRYGTSLSFFERVSDLSLFIFPILHTRLFYLKKRLFDE